MYKISYNTSLRYHLFHTHVHHYVRHAKSLSSSLFFSFHYIVIGARVLYNPILYNQLFISLYTHVPLGVDAENTNEQTQ